MSVRLIQFLRRYFLELVLFFIAISFLFILRPSFFAILSFLVSYLLFVLFINDTFLPKGIAEALKSIRKEYRFGVLILIFIALFYIWQFNFDAIVFLTILISFVLYDWDSRIIAAGALISMASCPVFLLIRQNNYAENMANYAYYLLVIAVSLQIISYWKRPELYYENNDE